MYCYNCGVFVDVNSAFCHSCGARITSTEHVYVCSVEDKVRYAVKRFFSSILFLTAVILFTVYSILYSYSYFTDTDIEVEDDIEIFDKISIPDESSSSEFSFVEIADLLDTGIVWTVALWLIYGFAKAKGGMKTGGIAMARVIVKIDRVIAFIIAALLLFDGIAMCFSEGDPASAFILFSIAPPLFAGIGILYILFQYRVLADINSLYSIAVSGVPTAKISKVVGVVCFIIAGIELTSISGDWISILSALTGGAALIIFGILFFRFRSMMLELSKEYNLAYIPAYAGQITNNNEL